jgi:homoprotocatechuate degradation regulator HpaR
MREFSRSLPMALLRAREAVMAEFRPILAAHDVTEQQWRVLRALVDEPDGLGVGQLAEATFLLGPSVSRIIAALQARGLVARSAVDHDGRRAVLTVTAAGMRLYESIAPASESAYALVEERFGAKQLDQLYRLLDELTTSQRTSPESR